ncbi:hypothetical protein LCGC14_1066740 [marine sediment metagenome]|uniref:Uncharacterized protein n=1 Tax=marine sediment metagenome TaxID=412755 RepID=A0A0F9QQ81_9ZZZZ
MTKTGIIKQIQKTQTGGYQSKQGWIYTFIVTIQTNEGQVTGEIGAKTEQYPLGVDNEINFTFTKDEYGYKFKKVNPQYAQGDSQGGGQATQGQNSGGRDYDAENRGKCRTQFIKAAIANGSLRCDCREDVLNWTEFAMTGEMNQPPQQSQQQGTPVADEDIPF